jgi:hypothetical protein
MDVAGSRWKIGYIQVGFMCGQHERAVRILDVDGVGGRAFVYDVSVNREEVVSTTGVGDSNTSASVNGGRIYDDGRC